MDIGRSRIVTRRKPSKKATTIAILGTVLFMFSMRAACDNIILFIKNRYVVVKMCVKRRLKFITVITARIKAP